MFYLSGSSPQLQLLRVLSHVPKVDKPKDALLLIIEIDYLEILHDDGTTKNLGTLAKVCSRRKTLRHKI